MKNSKQLAVKTLVYCEITAAGKYKVHVRQAGFYKHLNFSYTPFRYSPSVAACRFPVGSTSNLRSGGNYECNVVTVNVISYHQNLHFIRSRWRFPISGDPATSAGTDHRATRKRRPCLTSSILQDCVKSPQMRRMPLGLSAAVRGLGRNEY